MRLRTARQTFTVQVGDAQVDVSPLPASEIAELSRQHTRVSWKKGRQVEDFQASAFAAALFEATVQDWRGIQGPDGQPLPCNPETKRAAWEHNPGFVSEVLDQADAAGQAWQEDRGKNS